MPVTFNVALHESNRLELTPVETSAALLNQSAKEEFVTVERILDSSFKDGSIASHPVQSAKNGFIGAVFSAYNRHHHLVLRPDDIWQAIILQFSYYVNAHAEELRHLFVAHEGQKDLTVAAPGSPETYDWSHFPIEIAKLIEKNVVDPDLRKWIVPDFTTTTPHDEVVASVTMMATLQKYFTYAVSFCCGIPRVTLLGTRDDWVRLCDRVDKLTTFGEEPTKWHTLLKPVLHRFIAFFDAPDSQANVEFWQKICKERPEGSGSKMVSGWLTAFCFWTKRGRRLDQIEVRPWRMLEIDGAKYHEVDTALLPNGWIGVPVQVDDNGHAYDGRMVVGHVGIGHWEGDENTATPVSGWWMFELKKEEPKKKD